MTTSTGSARRRSLLGIRPGEGALVSWLALMFAVTQASHGLGMNTADALFFLRFGVEELPLMILISGLVVMGGITVHVVGLDTIGARRWLPLTAAASSLWVVLEWAGVAAMSRAAYPVIWISTQVIVWVTLTVMWNAAEESCDTRQAKRLFPVFASSGVAGGVVGNLVTGPLAAWLGTDNLLLVQAGLLAAGSALLVAVARFFTGEAAPPTSIWTVLTSTPARVWSHRLSRLASAAAFLVSALFFVVVFPFNEVVAATYDTEVEIAAFLGVFSSVATAATFVVSLLLTRRLLSQLGVVPTLLLVPMVYAAGFALWLVEFGLVTAAAFRAVQWVAVNAVWGTAFAAVFNVVPGRQRGAALGFMNAVPVQLGTVAAGLVLIAGDALPAWAELGLGLAVAGLAAAVVARMRPAYLDSVVEAVGHGLAGVFTLRHRGVADGAERDAIRVLEGYLDDERPAARAFAATSLARLGDSSVVPALQELLGDRSPAVRSAALDSMCLIAPDRIVDHVAAALEDDLAAVRLQAVRYLATDPNQGSRDLLRTALADQDVRVRAAAEVALDDDEGERSLVDSGDPRAVVAVLEESARAGKKLRTVAPDRFLDHEDPRVRAAAVAAGAGRDTPERLVVALDDRSPLVRLLAAQALSDEEAGRDLLLGILETGSVNATEAALRALVPMDDLEPRFVEWAAREARRAARLDNWRSRLDPEGGSAQRLLVSVLAARSRRLVGWVLLAMATSATRRIMPLVERGVGSTDPETRAQAVEALETVGARPVLEVLIPLLETPAGLRPDDHRETLHQISSDFDPWLRALAIRSLSEEMASDARRLAEAAESDPSDIVRRAVPALAPMPAEPLDTLDLMDRVLALHAVPMFSGLDPEDLELIAGVVNEVRYEPGERVYTLGEVGEEMLVIVEGTAVVSLERGGDRELIEEYGAGQIVGELAPLVGGTRAADVDAGEGGLHGVVLDRDDLVSILEEWPAVGMGMLGTLATRLREQT